MSIIMMFLQEQASRALLWSARMSLRTGQFSLHIFHSHVAHDHHMNVLRARLVRQCWFKHSKHIARAAATRATARQPRRRPDATMAGSESWPQSRRLGSTLSRHATRHSPPHPIPTPHERNAPPPAAPPTPQQRRAVAVQVAAGRAAEPCHRNRAESA